MLDTEAAMEEKNTHIPVMPAEVMEWLDPEPSDCLVDCTLGLGGHSRLLASRLSAAGRLIGIDRDAESLEIARKNLGMLACRTDFVHEDFRNIDSILEGLGVQQIDGILFDLGISSFQLDNPERGFSLKEEGPLDMRMDKASFISAYDLINSLSEKEISSILKKFGDERWHHRIARRIVARRPIQSTKELGDAVLSAMPPRQRWQKIHPATRTFQAFRIAVNRELESIEIALDKCIPFLNPGARICVISFHSLEDRISKQKLRAYAQTGELRLLTKKPLGPQEDEVNDNPRARSARLRAAEKI